MEGVLEILVKLESFCVRFFFSKNFMLGVIKIFLFRLNHSINRFQATGPYTHTHMNIDMR